MTVDHVLLTIEAGVADLRLNRPDTGNAIDRAMAEALGDAVQRLETTAGLRAVTITAAGKAFSVGGDLNHLDAHSDALRNELSYMIGMWHDVLPRLAALPAPVLTVLHGAVAGGALGLVWCADEVIASDRAVLVSAFTKLGYSGDGGSTWHLPRLVGLRRAQQFVLRSRPLTAAEALDWGLVSRVVPAADLDQAVDDAVQFYANGPTFAFGKVKNLLLRSSTSSYRDLLEQERTAMLEICGTKDVYVGMSAFLDGVAPTFTGQ